MTTYKIARELPLAFYMNRPYHKDIAPRTGKLSLLYLLLIRREFDYDKTNMCNSNTSCTGQEHSAQTLLTFQTSNKNMNIKMCVHDAFLNKPLSGTLKVNILNGETNTLFVKLGPMKPIGLISIVKIV